MKKKQYIVKAGGIEVSSHFTLTGAKNHAKRCNLAPAEVSIERNPVDRNEIRGRFKRPSHDARPVKTSSVDMAKVEAFLNRSGK